MAEIDRLSVALDADVAAFGRAMNVAGKRVSAFGQQVTKELPAAYHTAGAKAAREFAASLESEFRMKRADIQAAVAHGMMSPQAAEQAAKQLKQAFNKAMFVGVGQLGLRTDPAYLALMGVSLKDVTSKARAARGELASVGATSTATSAKFRSLAASMTSVAATMLPVQGGLLRVSTVLSSFALSSGVIAGAIAGVTALAAVWGLLAKRHKEAQQSAEDLEAALDKLTADAMGPTDQLLDEYKTATDDLTAARAKFNRTVASMMAAKDAFGGEEAIKATKAYRDLAAAVATAEERWNRLGLAIGAPGLAQAQDEAAERDKERIRLAREAAEEAKRLARERVQAAAETVRTEQERIRALTALVAAGLASVAQTDELRAAQQRLQAIMRDGTADVVKRAAAMEELTRITKALTEATLRQIQLAPITPSLRAPRGGPRTTGEPSVARDAASVSQWSLFRQGLQTSLADAFRNAFGDKAGMLAGGVQAGGAGGEILQVAQAAAAGLGPFAVLLPVINSMLQALEPVLTALLEPLKIIGVLFAAQLKPIIELLIPPLKFLAIVSSYVTQGFGWLLEAIGKFVNAIVPFGNPASGLVKAGKEMQRSAREARDSLKDLGETADKTAASMRNVPLIFDLNFRRTQVAQGGGRTATARAAGGVSIGNVYIQTAPGDSPEGVWRKFQRGMEVAAASGDVVARRLAFGT